MTQPERILVVEIKAMKNPGLHSSQLSRLTAHSNKGRLYLDSVDEIKSAVVDGIIHLGSNFRHPILFDVQVIPIDTGETNFDKPPSKGKRKRKRRSN